jgi:LacI family transcriptional regulator
MRNLNMAVTIRDVARAAGCSFKTVSRVINGEPYVTDEMYARVKAAILKTGYIPNVSARRLVTKQTNMICVLITPGLYQQDSAGLGRVIDAGAEHGYTLFFQPYVPAQRRSRDQLFDLVAQHIMDGFIITPPCDTDDFAQDLITTYKTPLVQVDPVQAGPFPCVWGSHASGAQEITAHLIAAGHQRIAFLEGPPGLRASAERLAGYTRALQAHGLPVDPEWIEPGEFSFEGGSLAVQRLFNKARRPTAIFAGSDMAALGALFALQALEIRVPGQVSVCGFDDLPVAGMVYPGLSTVSLPAGELLAAALLLLVRLLQQAPELETQLTLPARLVLRGSTAPPPDVQREADSPVR